MNQPAVVQALRAQAKALEALAAALDEPNNVEPTISVQPAEHIYEAELIAAVGSRDKAKKLIREGKVDGRVIGHTLVAKRASLIDYLNNEGSGARPRAKPNTVEATAEEVARAALRSSNVRVLPQRQWDARAQEPSNDTATTSTRASNSPTVGDVSSISHRRAKR